MNTSTTVKGEPVTDIPEPQTYSPLIMLEEQRKILATAERISEQLDTIVGKLEILASKLHVDTIVMPERVKGTLKVTRGEEEFVAAQKNKQRD